MVDALCCIEFFSFFPSFLPFFRLSFFPSLFLGYWKMKYNNRDTTLLGIQQLYSVLFSIYVKQEEVRDTDSCQLVKYSTIFLQAIVSHLWVKRERLFCSLHLGRSAWQHCGWWNTWWWERGDMPGKFLTDISCRCVWMGRWPFAYIVERSFV